MSDRVGLIGPIGGYRGQVTLSEGPSGDRFRGRGGGETAGPPGRFADDLIGLDPDDPEARAFAAHLDRMEKASPSTFTVEGQLAGVRDFAESANRADGARRLAAVVLVTLVLLGTGYVIFEALEVVLSTYS
jgi:hypothetical protein